MNNTSRSPLLDKFDAILSSLWVLNDALDNSEAFPNGEHEAFMLSHIIAECESWISEATPFIVRDNN